MVLKKFFYYDILIRKKCIIKGEKIKWKIIVIFWMNNCEKAMQERQVSIGGAIYKLPNVFIVITTQNPIEQEGTYILSEAHKVQNGEEITINSNVSVLFVIDTSTSMRALDYNGNNARYEGVINDCCNIIEKLAGCKFSVITFGNTAQKIIPFTRDGDTVQAELKSIDFERFYLYNSESSLNLPIETIKETLSKENEKENEVTKSIVFFISDGEITKKEDLESYSDIKQYVSNGAVMGYGTSEGGKMLKNDIQKEIDRLRELTNSEPEEEQKKR